MKLPTLAQLFEHMRGLGYSVFDNGDYDLNLFGIRSSDLEPTTFNDMLGCAYKKDGQWKLDYWPATTDPGLYWRENPSNVNGTAILVPWQYRSTYTIDLHSGKYLALCQRAGKVTVWRDADRDAELDINVGTQTGYFGINIHASSNDPYHENRDRGPNDQVGKWSAGCQVHGTTEGFREMMDLCNKQIETHPTWKQVFTYTLMDQWLP
jgi:hypothetical protein